MAHKFEFKVTVEVNRLEGKFVSRDDLEQELVSQLQDAAPSEIQVDESTYEVTGWEVDQG